MSAPKFTPDMIRTRFDEKVATGEVSDNPKLRAILDAFLDSPEAAAVLASDNASAPSAAVGYSDPGADPADEWDHPAWMTRPAAQTPAEAQLADLFKAGYGPDLAATEAPSPVMWGNDNGEGEAFIPLPADTEATVPGPPSILREAEQIVAGNREDDYGPAERNLRRIAGMWSAYLEVQITPRDVSWMMVHLKSSRDRHRRKRDNLVDGAGYLHLADQDERAA